MSFRGWLLVLWMGLTSALANASNNPGTFFCNNPKIVSSTGTFSAGSITLAVITTVIQDEAGANHTLVDVEAENIYDQNAINLLNESVSIEASGYLDEKDTGHGSVVETNNVYNFTMSVSYPAASGRAGASYTEKASYWEASDGSDMFSVSRTWNSGIVPDTSILLQCFTSAG